MTDTTEIKIGALYEAIMEWCVNRGADQINRLPGCWEREWSFKGSPATIAMNGHDQATKNSDGFSVPPFGAVIMINGWPAIVCGPVGGVQMGGSEKTENELIEALRSTAHD